MRNKAGMTVDAAGRTERLITIAELVLMKERSDAQRDALKAVLCAKFIEKQIQLGHAERHSHTMTMDDALDQAQEVLDSVREMEA